MASLPHFRCAVDVIDVWAANIGGVVGGLPGADKRQATEHGCHRGGISVVLKVRDSGWSR